MSCQFVNTCSLVTIATVNLKYSAVDQDTHTQKKILCFIHNVMYIFCCICIIGQLPIISYTYDSKVLDITIYTSALFRTILHAWYVRRRAHDTAKKNV